MSVATTGLVVILFTDLVGSTEVAARLGAERAEELRQTHFAALREGIREHAGTEVKNLGDGLMVAFGAASDAGLFGIFLLSPFSTCIPSRLCEESAKVGWTLSQTARID